MMVLGSLICEGIEVNGPHPYVLQKKESVFERKEKGKGFQLVCVRCTRD